MQNQLAKRVTANVGFLQNSKSDLFLGLHKVIIAFFQSDFVFRLLKKRKKKKFYSPKQTTQPPVTCGFVTDESIFKRKIKDDKKQAS